MQTFGGKREMLDLQLSCSKKSVDIFSLVFPQDFFGQVKNDSIVLPQKRARVNESFWRRK